ncbi:MAG: 5-(carboxyamino)imidazole ribonucleotide mutase [Acidimicrobiia bacterium]|nr:5-(carboxyamino)imidazole ribonucleotide mutase [Acidimicrobiia bacterium]
MMRVAVLMGSSKDRPIMDKAVAVLEDFEVPHVVRVLSAHKTPDAAFEFAATARQEGFDVIIAGAGKAAHLAGVMAAKTTIPVIGVPLSASLDGMDALLATVQMPTGVPVATVAIDGSTNAALLAIAILALTDDRLADRLITYRRDLAAATME